MSDGMGRKCVRMFNEGRQNVHNEVRSECPSLVNDDLVRKVNERVRDDRRFTISDLSLHFLRFQGLYSMTLSVVIWVIGKRVHDGCPRCSQRNIKTACCMFFTISEALSQGRRRRVEPYCDRRRDMGVPYNT